MWEGVSLTFPSFAAGPALALSCFFSSFSISFFSFFSSLAFFSCAFSSSVFLGPRPSIGATLAKSACAATTFKTSSTVPPYTLAGARRHRQRNTLKKTRDFFISVPLSWGFAPNPSRALPCTCQRAQPSGLPVNLVLTKKIVLYFYLRLSIKAQNKIY